MNFAHSQFNQTFVHQTENQRKRELGATTYNYIFKLFNIFRLFFSRLSLFSLNSLFFLIFICFSCAFICLPFIPIGKMCPWPVQSRKTSLNNSTVIRNILCLILVHGLNKYCIIFISFGAAWNLIHEYWILNTVLIIGDDWYFRLESNGSGIFCFWFMELDGKLQCFHNFCIDYLIMSFRNECKLVLAIYAGHCDSNDNWLLVFIIIISSIH